MKVGTIVKFAPSNIAAECKSIEAHHTNLPLASPGDNIGFNCRGISVKDIKRGFVASDYKNDPAEETKSFIA